MMKKYSLNMMAKSMLKKSDGVAMIELALILPVLLILVFGVFEVGRAIHAHNIITNMSREGANLASRTSAPVQEIMGSIALTAQPLNMTASGMIVITEVRGQGTSPTVPRAIAQNRWAGGSYLPISKVWPGCTNWGGDGECNDNFDDLTNTEAEAGIQGIVLKEGELVFAVEILYKYQSITTYVIDEFLEFHSQTIF